MTRQDGEPTRPDPYASARAGLLRELRADGITNESVLAAIAAVPRHEMVPEALREHAYRNQPLPIGFDQTISQPYIVAFMTELADLAPGERVLEVGTGSGYQAAVLAELGVEVYSIEIVEPLAERARALLDRLGYADTIHTRVGDGYQGWPEHAPYDAIVVTAAPPAVPAPLTTQLAVGGRLVIPVGRDYQELVVVTRTPEGFERQRSVPVRFVPMTGQAEGL